MQYSFCLCLLWIPFVSHSQVRFSYDLEGAKENDLIHGYILKDLDTIGFVNQKLNLTISPDSFKVLGDVVIRVIYKNYCLNYEFANPSLLLDTANIDFWSDKKPFKKHRREYNTKRAKYMFGYEYSPLVSGSGFLGVYKCRKKP